MPRHRVSFHVAALFFLTSIVPLAAVAGNGKVTSPKDARRTVGFVRRLDGRRLGAVDSGTL